MEHPALKGLLTQAGISGPVRFARAVRLSGVRPGGSVKIEGKIGQYVEALLSDTSLAEDHTRIVRLLGWSETDESAGAVAGGRVGTGDLITTVATTDQARTQIQGDHAQECDTQSRDDEIPSSHLCYSRFRYDIPVLQPHQEQKVPGCLGSGTTRRARIPALLACLEELGEHLHFMEPNNHIAPGRGKGSPGIAS